VARRVERDGTIYAGPFMPAKVARRTMSLAHRLFGIRSCNEIIDGRRDRPCLEYDIQRCLAPCVETICSIDRYGRAVEQARLLIEGRQEELIDNLETEMREAAGSEAFERAAHLRDAIRTIETLRDRRNKMEAPGMGDRDAFGVKTGTAGSVVVVFEVRRGRVCDRTELLADAAGGEDLLPSALQQFYAEHDPPPEIHLPQALPADDSEALEGWLTERAGRRVRLVVPQRGDKRGLLDLVARNAAMAYQAHFLEGGGAAHEALDTLRVLLALPALPRRIDCFDISTLQGRETVGAMVVAIEGRPRKGEYRKFKIRGSGPRPQAQGPSSGLQASGFERTASEPGNDLGPWAVGLGPDAVQQDDFAAIYEVVLRRYRRVLETGGPFPDLIVIDGGKGQLAAAYAALREIGLDRLVAIGLAKQEELIFTRDRVDGIALPRESAALRVLQRLRDEAHRFAITFHRASRAKRDFRSELDDVAGIGARRRKQLLTAFGSLAGVRRASRAELEAVVGVRVADAVLRHFAETT
jgi:excinuclease ABC subunit C